MSIIYREFETADQDQINALSLKHLGKDNFLVGRFNSVAIDTKTDRIIGFSSMTLGVESLIYAIDFDESLFKTGYFNGVCLEEEYRGKNISRTMYRNMQESFRDYIKTHYDQETSAYCFSHVHEKNFASQSYHQNLGFIFMGKSEHLKYSSRNNLFGEGAAFIYKKTLKL